MENRKEKNDEYMTAFILVDVARKQKRRVILDWRKHREYCFEHPNATVMRSFLRTGSGLTGLCFMMSLSMIMFTSALYGPRLAMRMLTATWLSAGCMWTLSLPMNKYRVPLIGGTEATRTVRRIKSRGNCI